MFDQININSSGADTKIEYFATYIDIFKLCCFQSLLYQEASDDPHLTKNRSEINCNWMRLFSYVILLFKKKSLLPAFLCSYGLLCIYVSMCVYYSLYFYGARPRKYILYYFYAFISGTQSLTIKNMSRPIIKFENI